MSPATLHDISWTTATHSACQSNRSDTEGLKSRAAYSSRDLIGSHPTVIRSCNGVDTWRNAQMSVPSNRHRVREEQADPEIKCRARRNKRLHVQI
eukprot:scaffold118343_cov90-Phaeocystis_antarctica.AAC.1